jgi:hypothetical protein
MNYLHYSKGRLIQWLQKLKEKSLYQMGKEKEFKNIFIGLFYLLAWIWMHG